MSIAVVVEQHCQKFNGYFKHLRGIENTFRCVILAFSVDYEKAGIDWPYKIGVEQRLSKCVYKGGT